MPVPRGPNFQPFARVQPPPRPKDAPVLAIGRRAIVTRQSNKSERVTLTDEGGTSTLGTIADGAQVEIVAWRPRRGDTRYRVVSKDGGLEGWVDAANLKPFQLPPPAKPVVIVQPATRPTLPIQTARGTTSRPRRSAAAAEGAAAKTASRVSKTTRVAPGKGAKLPASRERGRVTPPATSNA